MNRFHQWLCRSDRWRATVQQRVPWVLESTNLGLNVLELGPGPGLTTDLLRMSVGRLTALEVDPMLASALTSRLRGSNVEVIEGNATQMPFAGSEFSGVVAFTMLHHVPSRELQDQVLREVFRVLLPGGFFVGSDSRQSLFMRLIHIGDTLVPIDPESFGTRLESAGFDVHAVENGAEAFRFCARRPLSDAKSEPPARKETLLPKS
jgi:ubiquinone/menaquinone biosynthesis C-methylase UbiE